MLWEKRRAAYPGLQGSKQKLSPKTGFLLLGSVIPVFSLSLASSWANLGSDCPSVCFMSATEILEFCPAFYYFSVQISIREPKDIPHPLQFQDCLHQFWNRTRQKGLEVQPQAQGMMQQGAGRIPFLGCRDNPVTC